MHPTEEPERDETCSPEDVAELLGTSGWWVREQVRRGRVEHLRLGGRRIRFTQKQVEQLVKFSTVQRRMVTPLQMRAPANAGAAFGATQRSSTRYTREAATPPR